MKDDIFLSTDANIASFNKLVKKMDAQYENHEKNWGSKCNILFIFWPYTKNNFSTIISLKLVK